jgi:hypothetical protein
MSSKRLIAGLAAFATAAAVSTAPASAAVAPRPESPQIIGVLIGLLTAPAPGFTPPIGTDKGSVRSAG